MSLYAPFADLDEEFLSTAADALEDGAVVEFLVTRYLKVIVTPDPKLPYEVDFMAAGCRALNAEETRQAKAWTHRNIPRICRVWKQRHPMVRA